MTADKPERNLSDLAKEGVSQQSSHLQVGVALLGVQSMQCYAVFQVKASVV